MRQDPEQWPPESGLPGKDRFKVAADLQWGETPFDTLTRAELLRLVQAYHLALGSTTSCLRMNRAANPTGPYWGREGSGGLALARAEHLFDLCGASDDDSRERIYRAFFRMADSLLFADARTEEAWEIEVNGKEMRSPPSDSQGRFRPLEWRDFMPKERV